MGQLVVIHNRHVLVKWQDYIITPNPKTLPLSDKTDIIFYIA